MPTPTSGSQPTPEQRGRTKVAPLRFRPAPSAGPLQKKPSWIRATAPTQPKVRQLKSLLREYGLHTVCEEAACPNLGECFGKSTATFMIMGDLCTRRCPFCDVAHGRPHPLDPEEPLRLANAIAVLNLSYVVVTSVDRDDLRDGGAAHFAACIRAIRSLMPSTKIEILVPDFRGRMDAALEQLTREPPDVFNHNLETVPRLYPQVRPGADYRWSLELLRRFKQAPPQIPTKSGLMLGLGETLEEIRAVLSDLRDNLCDMATLGQYLQPSRYHLPVVRFVPPHEFAVLAEFGQSLGFTHVASGPMVRSSYHADLQAHNAGIG